MAPCQEGTAMKRSDAVIRQGSLGEVRERLTNIGVEGLTLTEVIGFGRQKGHSEFYRGCEYKVDFDPKLRLTIVAREDQVDEILDAIVGARAPEKSVTERFSSRPLTKWSASAPGKSARQLSKFIPLHRLLD
jgi:nitrogen regulatory protein PII